MFFSGIGRQPISASPVLFLANEGLISAASGAEKLFLVFVGLCSFVFAQPTALQPRDPSFVSKKEDRRC